MGAGGLGGGAQQSQADRHRDLHRGAVANLTHEDHLRRLPQGGAQRVTPWEGRHERRAFDAVAVARALRERGWHDGYLCIAPFACMPSCVESERYTSFVNADLIRAYFDVNASGDGRGIAGSVAVHGLFALLVLLLLVRGAVPGAKNGHVVVRPAVKARAAGDTKGAN